jgi:hypothetical protein
MLVMPDDDLNMALGPGAGLRISNNVALSLSKKVTEAQREIVHQLRTEALDHTRAETAEKEPDKGRVPKKKADREELNVQPGGDTIEGISLDIQQVNLTV